MFITTPSEHGKQALVSTPSSATMEKKYMVQLSESLSGHPVFGTMVPGSAFPDSVYLPRHLTQPDGNHSEHGWVATEDKVEQMFVM